MLAWAREFALTWPQVLGLVIRAAETAHGEAMRERAETRVSPRNVVFLSPRRRHRRPGDGGR